MVAPVWGLRNMVFSESSGLSHPIHFTLMSGGLMPPKEYKNPFKSASTGAKPRPPFPPFRHLPTLPTPIHRPQDPIRSLARTVGRTVHERLVGLDSDQAIDVTRLGGAAGGVHQPLAQRLRRRFGAAGSGAAGGLGGTRREKETKAVSSGFCPEDLWERVSIVYTVYVCLTCCSCSLHDHNDHSES